MQLSRAKPGNPASRVYMILAGYPASLGFPTPLRAKKRFFEHIDRV